VGDTLVGLAGGAAQRIALADARILRSRQPSTDRTTVLGLAVGGALLGATLFLVERGVGDNSGAYIPPHPTTP